MIRKIIIILCLLIFFIVPASSYAYAAELSLLGEESVELICGTPYTEAGYTAYDSDGNDIRDAVCICSDLNVMKCGEYTLDYSVEDQHGGKTSAQRLVTVCPASLPEKQPEEEKTIYLTFDDGPAEYTDELLDLLDEYDAKATFFVVGSSLEKFPEAVKKAADSGHSIGTHCTVHDFRFLYSSEEYFLNDLFEIREAVYELIGYRPDIMRLPGGSETAYQYCSHRIDGGLQVLQEDLSDLGIEYFDWHDSATRKMGSPGDSTHRILTAAEKQGSLIVLLHDTRYSCITATQQLLERGSEMGFRFKALSAATEAFHIR